MSKPMPWILAALVIALLAVAVWLRYSQKMGEAAVGEIPAPAPTATSTTSDPVVIPAAPAPVPASASNLQVDLQDGFDFLTGTQQEQFVSVSVNNRDVFGNGVRTNLATGLAKAITVPEVLGETAVLRVQVMTMVGVDQTFSLDLKQGRYVGVRYNSETKKLEIKQQSTPFQYD